MMKVCSFFVLLAVAALPTAALAKKAPTAYPATYAGGSLPLDHNKVRAELGKDEVIFMQRGQRISVPLKSITAISCGSESHRRFGVAVLGEAETYYIGVAWSGPDHNTGGAQALLKLSRGEYRGFLAALERMTGIRAVNTNQVPTVVHYDI